MKIAVFAKKTTLHKDYGGLETQNKVLCEGLASRGHELIVFSPKWNLTLDEAHENGVKYVFVDCVYRMGPLLGFFGSWQKNNWINRSVQEFNKFHQKEVFHIALAQSSAGLGIIKKKRDLEIRVISISHGTIIGEYKTFLTNAHFPKDLFLFLKNTGFILKNFFRRQRDFVHGSDKVVAVSNYVRTALIEETFILEDKVVVIHNGVDEKAFFQPHNLPRGSKVLYVGQIIASKGVNDILTIFKEKEFSTVQIDLLGSGDLLEKLREEVLFHPNLRDHVNLVGKIASYNKLIEKYYKNKEYGLFILPTKRFEGLPMVLIEAMFSGLPVVAYDAGGVKDALVNEETGYLVEKGNIELFKEKMLHIINNKKVSQEFSENSLKIAKERFTTTKMLDSYEEIIKEVLA